MVWSGMTWLGDLRGNVVWHNMVKYGKVWYGMAWPGMMWCRVLMSCDLT